VSISDREVHSNGRLVAGCCPEYYSQALGRATRQAWLALEIALAGPNLWDHISNSLPAVRENILRQQMETLLDLLSRAGLESEDPDVRRRYGQELRSARQANLLSGVSRAEIPQGIEDSLLNDAALSEVPETDGHVLGQIARDLEQAGYPSLAHLVELRSPWGEPLFPGMLEYFLNRSLRGRPDPGLEVRDDSSQDYWRCLEMTAHLLEECEEELKALLDRPEEAVRNGRAKGRNTEESERLYQLGLSRYQRGDYQQAAAHFTAAMKLDPTNVLLYSQRGDAYRLLCEYERAIADFQVALRLNPSAPAVLVSRAIAYHLSGEHNRAIKDCDSVVVLDPDNPTAYRIRAAAYAELGSHDQALADFTEAIIRAPEDDEAYYLRGVIHASQQNFAGAIADFDRALKLNRYHVPAMLHRGHSLRRQGEYGRAILDYSEVLRHHPSNVLAYSGRGVAQKLQGDLDRALADFTQALRLEPSNGQHYYHRGVLYRSKGDLSQALADLDEAIRHQPDNWPALYYRGKILLAQGHYSLAILDLTEVVGLKPEFLAAYLSRALVYDRLGHYREGVEDGTHAVKRDAASPAARLVRGVVYAHQGNRAAAIDDLTEAIQLDECLALAYHERSTLFTLQGDYDRAWADCNRLIALEPANALAYANRSIVYHYKGEVEQALTDYSRALQIDPGSILSGRYECLAESTRSRTIQRIADYIDGLRPETPVTDPPPPVKFRIVLNPPEANGAAGATRRENSPTQTPTKTEQSDTPLKSINQTATNDTRAKRTDPQLAVRLTDPEMSATARPQTKLAAPREESKPRKQEQAPSRNGEEGTIGPPQFKKGAGPEVEPAWASSPPPPPNPVVCRNSTFPLRSSAQPSAKKSKADALGVDIPLWTSAQQPAKKREMEELSPERWKKPMTIAAGTAVALLLLVFFRSNLFGNSGRLRVYPAQGKVALEGKPIANATIYLHPVGVQDPLFPRPRAIAQDDGTFVLGTYRKDDGAPAGEYKVTVQWFSKPDSRGGSQNLLPVKYAAPDTSGLIVRVQEGSNQIPPLQLTRLGKR
jgi:tetratricopeptide (TPR) repeat protein